MTAASSVPPQSDRPVNVIVATDCGSTTTKAILIEKIGDAEGLGAIAEDVDSIRIEVPDGYATFLMLREELAQYLTTNGVFRDVLFYVDVLMAQVYADYIGERGGMYLRTDFATPEDPMLHTRRILGLDGVDASGKMRLKAVDGQAEILG